MSKSSPTHLLRFVGAVFCLLFLGAVIAPGARADQMNKETKVTFSAPVQIPGFHQTVVLPAGTYVFKVLGNGGARNVVQIFSEDQSQLYSTVLAIPNYRFTPADETVIEFEERPANRPPALKAWFYPGDNYGQEFVYPKSEALEIAEASNQPVLAMPEEEASNIAQPATSAEAPSVAALERAPVSVEEPSGKVEPLSAVVQTRPSHEMVANALPKTASQMPLAALLGSLLIALGFGLRLFARQLG